MEENPFPRIEKIEQRLDRIEKKLRKQTEEKKMDLKEKFRLHDRAQTLVRQLESVPDYSAFREEVTNIVKNLAKLVDVALGVKFPS